MKPNAEDSYGMTRFLRNDKKNPFSHRIPFSKTGVANFAQLLNRIKDYEIILYFANHGNLQNINAPKAKNKNYVSATFTVSETYIHRIDSEIRDPLSEINMASILYL